MRKFVTTKAQCPRPRLHPKVGKACVSTLRSAFLGGVTFSTVLFFLELTIPAILVTAKVFIPLNTFCCWVNALITKNNFLLKILEKWK